MQIKEMANFIMYVLIELVFSDSYMYFDLNLNAIIIKLHDEAIYIYSFSIVPWCLQLKGNLCACLSALDTGRI
jgi:hypothetical protein